MYIYNSYESAVMDLENTSLDLRALREDGRWNMGAAKRVSGDKASTGRIDTAFLSTCSPYALYGKRQFKPVSSCGHQRSAPPLRSRNHPRRTMEACCFQRFTPSDKTAVLVGALLTLPRPALRDEKGAMNIMFNQYYRYFNITRRTFNPKLDSK